MPKAPPRVEVLHGRDPDSSCDLRIWINGREVTAFTVEDVDPGAGHSRAGWDERIAAYRGKRSAFAKAARAWLTDAADNAHITDDEDD